MVSERHKLPSAPPRQAVHDRPGDADVGDPQPFRDVLAGDRLLLTPEEAAEILRVGRTTIYALMKAGELHPVHIGRSCRLPRAELESYVSRLQAPVGPRGPTHLHSRPPR
jgi:excisionase family DNA binding protein